MIEKAFIVPHPPLIVPDVGRGEERGIQDTIDSYKAYAKEIAEANPDTIVISTPHSIIYRDYFHISPGEGAYGDFANFRAPQVNATIAYDTELVDKIAELAAADGIPAGTLGERDPYLDHATLIPIYFLAQEDPDLLKRVKFVRVGLSGLPLEEHYRLGKDIDKAAKELGRKVVYIASGDLSHVLKADGPYGYRPEGPEFDRRFVETIRDGDLKGFLGYDENFCEKASECGLRSFAILAGAMDDYDYTTRLDSYEGPFGVGYGCAEVEVKGEKDV